MQREARTLCDSRGGPRRAVHQCAAEEPEQEPRKLLNEDTRSGKLLGATCTQRPYDGRMTKVMQIRDVPDEVHEALVEAARAEGLSLTKYMVRELEHLAQVPQIARHNRAVIRRTQEKVQGRADRATILAVLDGGRGE